MVRRKKKKDRVISRFPEPDFLPEIKERRKWKDDYVRQVFFLTLLGATDVQIAQTFNIDATTLDYWKRTKKDFMESLKQGKTMADAKVSHSLYLAAIGYSHPDQVVLSNKIKEFGEDGKIKKEYTKPLIVDTVKSYPPNVTAAVKWLQARQPEVWGKRMRVDGQVEHNHKIDLSNFSQEELEILQKLGTGSRNNQIEDVDYTEE